MGNINIAVVQPQRIIDLSTLPVSTEKPLSDRVFLSISRVIVKAELAANVAGNPYGIYTEFNNGGPLG